MRRSQGSLVIVVVSAPTPSARGAVRRPFNDLHLTSVNSRRSGWRGRARRHDPEFGRRLFLVAAVHCDKASGVNAARVHKVVLRAVGAGLTLARPAGAPAVADDVALRARSSL